MRFRSDAAGQVVGVRFYKVATNTGTHIGHLWSDSGTQLATVTFSNETSSGWQQATFSSPVTINSGTTYVISYYAPGGHYSADSNYFASTGVDNAPLHALANGTELDGVYLYTGAPGGFPSNTYASTNYWVDVVFAPSQSYSISGTVSGKGGPGATVQLSGSASASTMTNGSRKLHLPICSARHVLGDADQRCGLSSRHTGGHSLPGQRDRGELQHVFVVSMQFHLESYRCSCYRGFKRGGLRGTGNKILSGL